MVVPMRVVNYKEAASRIAWQRDLRIRALRNELLAAVASRLLSYAPNRPTNIKHPWKPNEVAIRAWCPLHDGRWSRLIVRADDAGQLTFECFQGCSQDAIEQAIDLRSVTAALGGIVDAIANVRSTGHTAGRRVTSPGKSPFLRSSIHISADGRRLHLVTKPTKEDDRQRHSVTLTERG